MNVSSPSTPAIELVNRAFLSLPRKDPFDVSREPEYYGAIHMIAAKCGRRNIRPYAPKTWLHGWQSLKPLKFINQIIFWGGERDVHLVHTKEQKDFARNLGYKFAEAIGAPFTYVPKSFSTRIPGSLLVMPPHGIPQAEIRNCPHDYLDYMADLRREFEVVAACIHPHDCKNGMWPQQLSKLGIPWTTGASVEDRNALFRMRALFDLFESMTTNAIGSHVAYAAFCGCKVSVSGPFHRWDPGMFDDDQWYDDKQELLEHEMKSNDENNARDNYGHLFRQPCLADLQVAWAEQELGAKHRKNSNQLNRLFGWSKISKIIDRALGKKYAAREKL
jgi:hypothetical protein